MADFQNSSRIETTGQMFKKNKAHWVHGFPSDSLIIAKVGARLLKNLTIAVGVNHIKTCL